MLLAMCAASSATFAMPVGVQRTVPCDESIQTTPFPYLGNSQPRFRYRSLLNAVSVPPAYLQQVVATEQWPWRYWHKAGLGVRARHALTITVPPRWRTRAAIDWGNRGGPYETLHIAACPGSPHSGNAYAGGLYLHPPSACVPLIFTVDGRSATIRFGLATHCR